MTVSVQLGQARHVHTLPCLSSLHQPSITHQLDCHAVIRVKISQADLSRAGASNRVPAWWKVMTPSPDLQTSDLFQPIYYEIDRTTPYPACKMSVAVIQGASGGLGLNLTRHILANTSLKVYALTHRASSDVQERILANAPSGISERLSVVGEVDVREENGLEKVAGTIKQRDGKGSVRLVACLAGIVGAMAA